MLENASYLLESDAVKKAACLSQTSEIEEEQYKAISPTQLNPIHEEAKH